VGTAVFCALVSIFGVWVLTVFCRNLQAFRSGKEPFSPEPTAPADKS
jgi:hypothetical protein